MNYLKKALTEEDLDNMRIWLSIRKAKIQLDNEPVCDFCGVRTPAFVYAASKASGFSTAQMAQESAQDIVIWRWAACVGCSNHIDRNNWRHIIDNLKRFLALSFPLGSNKVLEAAVNVALDEFHRYSIKTLDNNDDPG